MKPISTLVSKDHTVFDLLYERYQKDMPLYTSFGNENNRSLYSPVYFRLPRSTISQLANYSVDPRGFESLLLNCCHSREIVKLGEHRRFQTLNELKEKDELAFALDKNLQEFLGKAPDGCYLARINLPPSVSQLMGAGASREDAFKGVYNYTMENVGKHMQPMKGLCMASQVMICAEKLFIDSEEFDLENYKGPLYKGLDKFFTTLVTTDIDWSTQTVDEAKEILDATCPQNDFAKEVKDVMVQIVREGKVGKGRKPTRRQSKT